jgi:hypothetical protein
MNVVFIIGNGFDLRLGLPTSYPDFLRFYREQKSNDSKIDKMKQLFFYRMEEREKNGETNWRDLEVALGEFTEDFQDNKELFRDFYLDINTSLTDYLKKVEKHFWEVPTPEESEKFFQDLMYPYTYLNPSKRKQIQSRIKAGQVIANIISFNYTSSLESLLSNNWKISTNYNHKLGAFQLSSIKHIHHTLNDNGILFGVNDPDQIANDLFKRDNDILDLVVKPTGNEVVGNLVDDDCRTFIGEALLICIFGTSLGETDKLWWECIHNRFIDEPQSTILFFDYQPDSAITINTQRGGLERKARQKIMNALKIDGNESEFQDRIFIASNTDIFPSRPKINLDRDTIDKFSSVNKLKNLLATAKKV